MPGDCGCCCCCCSCCGLLFPFASSRAWPLVAPADALFDSVLISRPGEGQLEPDSGRPTRTHRQPPHFCHTSTLFLVVIPLHLPCFPGVVGLPPPTTLALNPSANPPISFAGLCAGLGTPFSLCGSVKIMEGRCCVPAVMSARTVVYNRYYDYYRYPFDGSELLAMARSPSTFTAR